MKRVGNILATQASSSAGRTSVSPPHVVAVASPQYIPKEIDQ